jgi:hypothetical protein
VHAADPCDLSAFASPTNSTSGWSAGGSAAQTTTNATTQSFTLRDPALSLEGGATDGCATMILVGDGKGSSTVSTITELRDIGLPNPPKVDIQMRALPLASEGATGNQVWVIAAKVEGLPANTKQSRNLAFSSGGRLFVLPYTLSNRATESFSWTIKAPPSEIHVGPGGQPIPVMVTVGPVRATDVRLMNAVLIEKTRKTTFDAGGMRLCLDRLQNCDERGLTLPANSADQLWLLPVNSTAYAGQFTGQLTISSAEKPSGDAFPLTIYVSSCLAPLFGVLVIAVGVVATWFISVYARNLVNRDQMLLPIRLMVEQLNELRVKLNDVRWDGRVPKCLGQIDDSLKSMEPRRLVATQVIPPTIPLPWTATLKPEDYRQLLQDTGSWMIIIRTILREGLERAWTIFTNEPSPPKAEYDATIEKLDSFATKTVDGKVPVLDKLRQDIATELQRLRTTIPQPRAPGGPVSALALTPGVSAEQTSTQLTVQIARISVATWIFIAIATIALGYYVLILPNLGFGLPGDYLLCLLWGLGLPLGAQQLAQSSSSSIATALGVNVPK